MSRLSERKTRLAFITNASVKYRGKFRSVVIEAQPEIAVVRLLGTRVRYEVWGIHDYAARVSVNATKKLREVLKAGRRK